MLRSLFNGTLAAKARRFIRSESGMTLPFIAGSLVILMGFTGIAIDMARLQMVQAKLQFAVDSAGLAAGAKVSTADADIEFRKYLNVNFNGYMGSTLTGSTIMPNSSNTIFQLSASATMPTTFMSVMGVHSVTLSASSEISREVSGLELVFVLDNTGSMSDSAGGSDTKLEALQTATKTLINKLFGSSDMSTNDKLFVGIVPFAQTVNIGTSHPEWIEPNYTYRGAKTATGGTLPTPYSDNLDWGPYSWKGCVYARLNNLDVNDAPPTGSGLFGKFYWTSDNLVSGSPGDNDWHLYSERAYKYSCSGCGSNAYTCPVGKTCTKALKSKLVSTCQSSTIYNETGEYCTLTDNPATYTGDGGNLYCSQPITPMTNNAATLRTAVDGMKSLGATDIPQGLQWGWLMLSPKWRGYWGGLMNTKGLPLDYHSTGMAKAIVLLTDGVNTVYSSTHGAYWFPKDNRMGTTYTTLDAKTSKLCTEMKKNENIVIFTIALGTDDMNTTLLKNCASDDAHAFISPTTTQLANVFNEIGDSLSNLRVSH